MLKRNGSYFIIIKFTGLIRIITAITFIHRGEIINNESCCSHIFVIGFNSNLLGLCGYIRHLNNAGSVCKSKTYRYHYTIRKETIRFSEDNTFIDTVFYNVSDLPGTFYVRYVAAGSYTIKDMEIYFSDVRFRYYKNVSAPLKTTAVEFFDSRFPDMQDEFIFFRRPVSLFRDNPGEGLAGQWNITHQAAVYNKDSDNQFSSGMVTEEYDFKPVSKDGGECRYRRKYLFDSGLPDEDTTYHYLAKQAYLNISPIVDIWYTINGNEMTWYGSADDNMLYEKVK